MSAKLGDLSHRHSEALIARLIDFRDAIDSDPEAEDGDQDCCEARGLKSSASTQC
jgi:hypothetical protein